jgi:hypothetical protein
MRGAQLITPSKRYAPTPYILKSRWTFVHLTIQTRGADACLENVIGNYCGVSIMTNLLLGLCFFVSLSIFSQTSKCDTLFPNGDIGNFLRTDYKSINADTMLAIFQTDSRGFMQFELLCWKSNGQYQFLYRKAITNYRKKNGKRKVTVTSKLESTLENHVINFYLKRLYEFKDQNEDCPNCLYKGFSHDDYTMIRFRTQSTCWQYRHNSGNPDSDCGKWTDQLRQILYQ